MIGLPRMRLFFAILVAVIVVTGCGRDDQSDVADSSSRSSSNVISIFTWDGSRFSFGRPERRETKLEMSFGSSRGSSSNRDDGGSWSSNRERARPDRSSGNRDDRDDFVFEACRERFNQNPNAPSIRAVTQYEIRSEQYRSRQEAERAFSNQLSSAKDGLTAAWKSNKSEIDLMRGAIRAAATTHNKDVMRTLDIASKAVQQGSSVVQDLATKPFTSAGIRVRDAAKTINNAWKELPSKFNGLELEKRGAMLKHAGSALKVADSLFAGGDKEAAEHFLDVSRTLVDVALSYTPVLGWVKDVVEASTGYSVIHRRDLTNAERAAAIVGAVTGGVGSKVIATSKALRSWGKFFKESNAGQHAMDALVRATQILGH